MLTTSDVGFVVNRQAIINSAINEVVSEQPCIVNSPVEFACRAMNRATEKMIDYFPEMCEEARRINQLKYKFLKDHGNQGKFTETYGWSNDGTFLFEYDIPPDLYHFMSSAVFKDFWGPDNDRIWKPFMKKVCRGNTAMLRQEAMDLLMKVKSYYGSNKDASLTR